MEIERERAYQIRGLSRLLFGLSCVTGIRKVDGHPVYTLTDYVDEMGKRHYVMDINGDAVYFAQFFDWLVFDGMDWYVLTNQEYTTMF